MHAHLLTDMPNIKCIEPHYLIPLENLLFLVKNIYNPKKILEHFIK